MSTFQIPNADPGTLAGALSSWNFPGTTISPNGTGSTITTNNANDDLLSSALNSAGFGSSSSNGAGGANDAFLNALEGQDATTPSATTFGGTPQQSDSLTGTGPVAAFFAQYGVDAISIVIGLIIVAVSVVKLV